MISSQRWELLKVKTLRPGSGSSPRSKRPSTLKTITAWSFSAIGRKESMVVSDMFSQERIIHYVSTTSKKNLRKHHHTSLNGLVFKAAKAATPREFDETINEMKALHKAGGNYIEGIGKERWARAFFTASRFGHVTSNISESMNHWLEEARHRDLVGLFSTYIRNFNRVFEKRRDEYRSMNPTTLQSRVAELSTSHLKTRGNLLFCAARRMCLKSKGRTSLMHFVL